MKKRIKWIHFVGIKGVGMAPLAIIAKEAGFKVTGSDISDEFITDSALNKAGIKIFDGFSKVHVSGVDLVITTGAHGGFNNEEVIEAKQNNIDVITQGEAVGIFMKGEIFNKKLEGISVAGCHGKTTTTAMLATIFKECRQDPSFIIGTGEIASLGAPGHFGKGKYFIAEADEYATEPNFNKTPKLLWQHPKIAIFTNIEFDHPDLYNSLDEIREVFLKFANQLPNDGLLIANGDDLQTRKLLENYNGKTITFGKTITNNYVIKRISITSDQTFFWVDLNDISLGEFVLNVIGEHNVMNALGAIVAALETGMHLEDVKKAIKLYKGSKRRFEFIGQISTGALLFDDYAHHPTEIKKTLEAFKKAYPKHKIACLFQPHTYSRTKSLLEEFIYSFSSANTTIITNIYSSLREKKDSSVSSQTLVQKLNERNIQAFYIPELSDVVKYVKQKKFGKEYVIITMGAGDIYKIHGEILK